MTIQHISAVTFAVREMSRSVGFYRKLGFKLIHGSQASALTSLRAGAAFVNLALSTGFECRWWWRAICRVDDAEVQHLALTASGIKADLPREVPWGERYFHITDPDAHELSCIDDKCRERGSIDFSRLSTAGCQSPAR